MNRKTKNILLILINILFALILVFRLFLLEQDLSNYLYIWLISSPFVILIHLIKVNNPSIVSLRDALLFLLTGGSIGNTVAALLKGEASYFLELPWLIIALSIALIHYSASKKDRYTNHQHS